MSQDTENGETADNRAAVRLRFGPVFLCSSILNRCHNFPKRTWTAHYRKSAARIVRTIPLRRSSRCFRESGSTIFRLLFPNLQKHERGRSEDRPLFCAGLVFQADFVVYVCVKP
jgi:hypothetical protein